MPVMRETIAQVKRRNGMSGRPMRVADKGLKTAESGLASENERFTHLSCFPLSPSR